MKITFDILRAVPKYLLFDRNGYALAKAIEAAFQYVAQATEDGLDIILDVEKMPEWRLDEMARETGVPYDYTARIEQKREWIRNAIPMYQILGTKGAIRQYLEGYFGEIEIQENWEYAGDPFHFRVTVGGEWTPETEAWAVAAIERTKPVRSVLDDFRIGCRAYLAIRATGDVKDRFRFPSAGEITAGEYPTENHLYLIDATPQEAIHAEAQRFEVLYEMAGERPEINHMYIPDNDGNEGGETEEITRMIYYPLCGDVICGE